MENTMEAYGDVHRALLQNFMLKKAHRESNLLKTFNTIMQEYNEHARDTDNFTAADLNAVISEVNKELDTLQIHLMIKSRIFIELDGHKYWVLVNTRSDDIATLSAATSMQEWKLILLKSILKGIVESDDGFVTRRQINKYVSEQKSAKGGLELEEFLERLIEEQWLAEGKRKGVYTTGIRSLTELVEFLAACGLATCPKYRHVAVPTKYYHEWISSMASGNPHNSWSDSVDEEDEEEYQAAVPQQSRGTRRSTRHQEPVDSEETESDESNSEQQMEDNQEESTPEPVKTPIRKRSTGPKSVKARRESLEQTSPVVLRRSARKR